MPELHKYKGDNLYAKIRFNLNHNGTGLHWRLFIKDGEKEEILHLCTEINFYKPGMTYSEIIDGVGHFSILIKSDKIIIDDKLVGWVL